jgi:uncharacterized protein
MWVYEVWYNLPAHMTLGALLTLAVVAVAGLALMRWWHGLLFVAIITVALPLLSGLSLLDWMQMWQMRELFLILLVWFSAFYGFRRLVLWSVRTPQRAAGLLAGVAAVLAGVVSLATLAPLQTPSLIVEMVQAGRDALSPACSPINTRYVPVPPLPAFDDTPTSDAPLPLTTTAAFADVPSVHEGKVWDHFIGPYKSIRTPAMRDFKWPEHGLDRSPSVRVPLVVGELGQVLAAGPITDPSVFHDEAFRIAKRWKFQPFRIGGKPSRARLTIDIPMGRPETGATRHAAFPAVKDWDSLAIRLSGSDHDSEWGQKIYDLTIRGDGSVTYFGYRGVVVLGRHCAVIARDDVRRLVDAFRQAGFFSLDNDIPPNAERYGRSMISVSFDGRTKSVAYNNTAILLRGRPDAVMGLPILVRQAAYTQRWTSGNEFTVPSLIAENWDFSRGDYANRSLVLNAATYYPADAETVRALIAAGAPVSTETSNTFGTGALEAALQSGNVALARVLLSANVRWPRDQLSGALVYAAGLGDVSLVDELVKRGAQFDGSKSRGKTALMTAAELGTARVVERLLRAGANPASADPDGRTALHFAVAGRKPDRVIGPDGKAVQQWDGKSELRIPAGEDVRRVVELLLDARADVNARDKNGATPLISAWTYGEDAAPVLIARGADVNAQDTRHGETALMICRNPKVTQLLLDAGADPYMKDRAQKTALDYARARSDGANVAAVLQVWMTRHPPRAAGK